MISPNDSVDLSDLEDCLLHQLTEAELLEELTQLQTLFTVDRNSSSFKHYTFDSKKVSAYTAFYLPSNLPKWDYLWKQIEDHFYSLWADVDFIDYGSGPGTYSLAFLRSMGARFQGRLHLVDHSREMLEQARKVLAHFCPEAQVSLYERSQDLVGALSERARVLFFGHSLNEMEETYRERLIDQIDPTDILWIEPGTKGAFHSLLPLREVLLKKRYQVLYPCLTGDDCPLQGSSLDWCHQVIHVSQPPEVSRIAQLLKLNRHELPMIGHVYSKRIDGGHNGFEGEHRDARVLRVRKPTKHSFEWDLCLKGQGELKWIRASLPKRGFSKKDLKKISSLVAGDSISLRILKKLEAQHFRIELLGTPFTS